MSAPKAPLLALRDEREETIRRLTEAFASDLIDVDEFEHRVDQAHRAGDCEALVALRRDITPVESAHAAPSGEALVLSKPETQTALVVPAAKAKWIVSIMGSTERKGSWRVPKRLRVTSIMGATLIDFREAVLSPGITEVKVLATMGAVEIIVPPTLAVECEGWGIAGAFETLDRFPTVADPDQPLVRIAGLAVAGSVEIQTRLVGESARQARKRTKLERKAREKALAGKEPKQLG